MPVQSVCSAHGRLRQREPRGVGYAEGMGMGRQLAVQALGIGVTMLWCGVLTFVILKVVNAIVGLRVTEEQETGGPGPLSAR